MPHKVIEIIQFVGCFLAGVLILGTLSGITLFQFRRECSLCFGKGEAIGDEGQIIYCPILRRKRLCMIPLLLLFFVSAPTDYDKSVKEALFISNQMVAYREDEGLARFEMQLIEKIEAELDALPEDNEGLYIAQEKQIHKDFSDLMFLDAQLERCYLL